MATAKANILIGDKKIDPYCLYAQQRSNQHHQLAVSIEKIEATHSFSLSSTTPLNKLINL